MSGRGRRRAAAGGNPSLAHLDTVTLWGGNQDNQALAVKGSVHLNYKNISLHTEAQQVSCQTITDSFSEQFLTSAPRLREETVWV